VVRRPSPGSYPALKATAITSVDEVCHDLKRHLDWTARSPSLVFVASSDRASLTDLGERVELWASRQQLRFRRLVGSGSRLSAKVTATLPAEGATVVMLPWSDPDQRYQVLARLNELRARLAASDQGGLIVLGPSRTSTEAALRAADLWAVRSLDRTIDSEPSPRDVGGRTLGNGDGFRVERIGPAASALEVPRHDLRIHLIFPAMTLTHMTQAGDAPTHEVMSAVRTAAQLALTDLTSARAMAAQAVETARPGHPEALLALVASAELADLDGDRQTLRARLTRALAVELPATPDSIELWNVLGDIAERYHDPNSAKQSAMRHLADTSSQQSPTTAEQLVSTDFDHRQREPDKTNKADG
jgi:hypothetical protein